MRSTPRRSPRRRGATAATAALTAALVLVALPCRATSREECIDAHGRGQDLREHGALSEARRTFLACAQSTCPTLVQQDCARFAQEVESLVPSVSFAARDGASVDLPDTAVYVDGVLVAERLGDGRAYDVDPGKHSVRFVHAGRAVALDVIVNEGERGRALVATFEMAPPPAPPPRVHEPDPPEVSAKRSPWPLVVAGTGAAALIAGGLLLYVGLHDVPDRCSIGSRECAVPPGDPALSDAHRALGLVDTGIAVGAGGAAVLAGGLVFYLLEPRHRVIERAPGTALAPWVAPGSGGVAVSSRF